MFQFDTTTTGSPAAHVAPDPKPMLDLAMALGVARRNAGLMLVLGFAGAVAAYGLSNQLTPKYVATAEIYVDPGSAQGASSDPIAPGQDSNGFVNYVESQKLIVTSRSVLERVVRAEKLDGDPDFIGADSTSLIGELLRGSSPAPDPVATAARALLTHVQVARPERTFIIDISVSNRDPQRAAELANAGAKAYVEEVQQMRADASKQTGSAIAERLENLRLDVIRAEEAIEAYRTEHGLAGARDGSSLEVQLKALQDQMATQRARESDALARAEGAEAARKNPADLSAFAAQFGLMTLSQLRSQQAEAHQKLADVRTDLGPRHPQAMEAEARAKSADEAVDAELVRFGRAQRLELQRAKLTQADLQRQLEAVMKLTNSDDQALIGLRDLERRAQAARDVYELFVQRSRDTGAIQEVAPTRTKIITAAGPPKSRSFPPNSILLACVGFVAGMGLGFVLALAREAPRLGREPQPFAPPAAPAMPVGPRPDEAAWADPAPPEDVGPADAAPHWPYAEPAVSGALHIPPPPRPDKVAAPEPAAAYPDPPIAGPLHIPPPPRPERIVEPEPMPAAALAEHRVAGPLHVPPPRPENVAELTARRAKAAPAQAAQPADQAFPAKPIPPKPAGGALAQVGASRRHLLGVKTRLVARPRPLSLDELDLTGLGFPIPVAGAEVGEFRELLGALPRGAEGRQVVVVAGGNEAGRRSTLAVNLAIVAARADLSVALIDAAGRNARLTRAVRLATRRTVLEGGPIYETVDGVALVLPKAGDVRRGRVRPATALEDLIEEKAYDLILLDGPDPSEVDAKEIFDMADAVVALDEAQTLAALAEIGVAPSALAVFAPPPAAELKRA
jgi:uncharacterized protein involved in exopolysaccharide biosynthesis/Mrp family chromosome partitioning ATPase